jgi:hypothetical protein
MDISLGFIIAFVLILFPGLIIRRLFYYGEFSKQFSGGFTLIKLIAIASIPGLINLVGVFFFYDNFISHIDLESIINTYKDLNNPDHHVELNKSKPVSETIKESLLPFFSLIYTSSLLIGLMAGRLIRIARIDTKFKLLRFKNYWFYVFSGELTKFKKLKHLKESNKKHLFTVADILVDSDGKSNLYSGIVVDYELNESNCQLLNKVVLQNAERFRQVQETKERVKIPGNLFVVDCSKMRNINLTYIFEESTSFLESMVPTIVTNTLGLIELLLIPVSIFKTDFVFWSWYVNYFNLHWYEKIVCYFLVIAILDLFNPFTKKPKEIEYKYVSRKLVFAKISLVLILLITLYLLI